MAEAFSSAESLDLRDESQRLKDEDSELEAESSPSRLSDRNDPPS